MAFQKVEFTFPDEQENKKPDIEIEKSSAVEVDIPGKSKSEEKPQSATTNCLRDIRLLSRRCS